MTFIPTVCSDLDPSKLGTCYPYEPVLYLPLALR